MAARLSAPALVSMAPPATSAWASFTPTFRAKDPPVPKPAVPVCFAVAKTVLLVGFTALRLTSAPPASITAPSARYASTSVTDTSSANAPVPPKLPELAPDAAVTSNVWLPSVGTPAVTLTAVAFSKTAVPEMYAWLSRTAILPATAAPAPL